MLSTLVVSWSLVSACLPERLCAPVAYGLIHLLVAAPLIRLLCARQRPLRPLAGEFVGAGLA
eukprot:12910872-Alexandrium_andersonii.AAC.1